MQTDIFIPLKLVLEIYIAGVILDNLSTYCCAKISGLKHFFHQEQNEIAKTCVKKFGLTWGLMLCEAHPKKIFSELLLIGFLGISTISLAENAGLSLKFIVPGLLFIGFLRIYAGLNNLNVIRTDYWLYHPKKSIIEEEQ